MTPNANDTSRPTRSARTRAAACAWLCSAALLTIAPGAQAADAADPVAVTTGANAAELAGKLTRISEPATLKGIRRVAVPQFSVHFVTSDSVTAETSGFAAAGRARVSANYLLLGVAEPDFQAMAQALYADFVASLQASGLDVVSYDEISAAPSYRKLVAGGTPLPLRSDIGVTVAPAGMALYGTSRMLAKPVKGGGLLAGFTGLSDGLAAVNSIGDVMALGKELGDAALLDVNATVNFVELKNDNKGFLGRLSNTASVSAKSYPSIATATLAVQVGANYGRVTLDKPLVLDASAFSEVREQAKSGTDVAGAVAVGLLRMALGSKDSSDYSTFEAVADPTRYRQVVGGGLGLVNQMFVQQLQSAR